MKRSGEERGGGGDGDGEFQNPVAEKKLIGAYRRRSGNYYSEVWDRRRRQRIWLGTFRTAAEASAAYLSRRRELDEEFRAKKGRKTWRKKQRTAWIPCGEKIGDSPPSIHDESGAAAGEDVSGEETGFLGGEEESRAKEGRKPRRIAWIACNEKIGDSPPPDLEIAAANSSDESGGAAGEDVSGEKVGFLCGEEESRAEEGRIAWIACGEKIGDSAPPVRESGAAAGEEFSGEKIGFLDGVEIVDPNGFLVGEFSQLDDLSISTAEDGVVLPD